MDGQYAPWLCAVRKVRRVLGKSSNDVTARLDYFVEIVRLGIALGYGNLAQRSVFPICPICAVVFAPDRYLIGAESKRELRRVGVGAEIVLDNKAAISSELRRESFRIG